jgi:hypothetical protein
MGEAYVDAVSEAAGSLMLNSRRLHLQALIFVLMFIGWLGYEIYEWVWRMV